VRYEPQHLMRRIVGLPYVSTNLQNAQHTGLAQLQAEHGGKSRITIRVDNDTLTIFKARAEMSGGDYQTLMNEALRQFAQGITLADVMRETIRKELHHV